jgi:hypothetical protein
LGGLLTALLATGALEQDWDGELAVALTADGTLVVPLPTFGCALTEDDCAGVGTCCAVTEGVIFVPLITEDCALTEDGLSLAPLTVGDEDNKTG